ncbi:flagellar basal body-associated FliL family protein [Brevundimonas vesicularis]|uniref:flagellar basal body-associated FliL family protein n=1 Tax=Brevundimonas vesicularis TaxID=41276 RepID=UPI0038D3D8F8
MLKLKLGKKKDSLAGEAGLPVPSDVDGQEAETRKKPPLLIIIAAAALVVLAGGGATAFFLLKPKPAAADGATDAGEGAPAPADAGGGHGAAAPPEGSGTVAAGPDGVTFYTLPDMIVNIQSVDGRPTYLKLRLTLEMKDASLAARLQGQHPRMNDMFQSFLRELRPDDLAGSAGSYQLRAEILRRVNLIAAPGKVDAVLIEEMLVQ